MARWNEADHPRDSRGRFADVPGIEISVASGRRGSTRHTTITARQYGKKVGHIRLGSGDTEIDELQVTPSMRGRGLGRGLIGEALDRFGDRTLSLHASPLDRKGPDRAGLMAMYAKHGFVPDPDRGPGYMKRAPGRPEPGWVSQTSDSIAQRRGLPAGRGGMRPATPEDLERVRQLTGKKIPPAWTDVRVAQDLDGARLLVQGKDAKGRLQSVYSAAHTQAQAAAKFKRVTELMGHLDKLDHAIGRDADTDDSAAALMLIRRLGMRPGSDRNTGADKAAHGATNLRARHVKVDGTRVSFDFTGKKGVHIQLEVDDPDIARVVSARLRNRSGDDRLFDTSETRTRDYMRSTGVPQEFLLKDLRTVRANVVALAAVQSMPQPTTVAQFRRQRRQVAELVSAQLGNTPTLALASYINPTVFGPWVKQEDWL